MYDYKLIPYFPKNNVCPPTAFQLEAPNAPKLCIDMHSPCNQIREGNHLISLVDLCLRMEMMHIAVDDIVNIYDDDVNTMSCNEGYHMCNYDLEKQACKEHFEVDYDDIKLGPDDLFRPTDTIGFVHKVNAKVFNNSFVDLLPENTTFTAYFCCEDRNQQLSDSVIQFENNDEGNSLKMYADLFERFTNSDIIQEPSECVVAGPCPDNSHKIAIDEGALYFCAVDGWQDTAEEMDFKCGESYKKCRVSGDKLLIANNAMNKYHDEMILKPPHTYTGDEFGYKVEVLKDAHNDFGGFSHYVQVTKETEKACVRTTRTEQFGALFCCKRHNHWRRNNRRHKHAHRHQRRRAPNKKDKKQMWSNRGRGST